MLGGVLWIAALTVLLAGVVALNVAVLQLNVGLDRLARERAQLRAANATLAAQLSSAAATPQVEALAGKRLGLVPAAPEQTTYVELERGR
jgi:cell division protein FtsL